MSLAWDLLYAATSPLWLGGMAAVRLRGKRLGMLRADRFGRWVPPPAGASPRIWVHAASVGEVRSLRALVPGLQGAFPAGHVWITVQTPTGHREACALFPDASVSMAPLDLTPCLAGAFGTLRPDALLVVEREWWPGLFAEARRRGVPLLHIGTRLSERSLRRARRTAWAWRSVLRGVSWFGTRDEETQERLRSLGCDPARIETIGDLKVDAMLAARPRPVPGWLAGWLREGPLLLGVSTHPGEEALLLDVLDGVRREIPAARLVLAPRHAHRFAAAAAVLSQRGAGGSSWGAREARGGAFLLDAIGEVDTFYPHASAAFVGGTWAPVGGHNLLEPAAAAVPVLYGPRTENVAGQVAVLEGAGGGCRGGDAASLVRAVLAWVGTPAGREAGGRAREVVRGLAGATDRAVGRVREVLARGAAGSGPAT